MKKYYNVLVGVLIYLLIFAYIDDFRIFIEIKGFFHQQAYLKGIIYFAIYLLTTYSVMILLNFYNNFIKYISYILVFASSVLTNVYSTIDPHFGFAYGDALNILQLLNSFVILEASGSYSNYIIYSSVKVFLLFVIIFLVNKFLLKKKFKFIYVSIPFLTFIVVYYLMIFSNSNRLAYNPLYKVIDLFIYTYNHKLYNGKRENVTISVKHPRKFKNIIYIVDESIRGDKLGINGFNKNTTPFLDKQKIYNYGVASSGGVCSDYSEDILLTGVQLKNLPDKNSTSRKIPTIFQYAKKAGYETSLVDLMIHKINNRHFLMESDFNYIDNLVDLSKIYKVPAYLLDLEGIKELKKIINNKKYNFIYFVKYGSHFHYESSYPKSQRFFKPTQQPNKWKWDIKDKPKFLNSYYNSIRWSSDHFFKELYKELNNTDTLIVYTSDHGQNLMDDMSIEQTHCAKGPAPKAMAKVPLFMISMNNKTIEYKKENINHASHFNLFGTNLYFMGYDIKDINRLYGKILINNLTKQERYFTSGDIFGRSKMYKNKF